MRFGDCALMRLVSVALCFGHGSSIDYTQFFEPSSIAKRIREITPNGVRLPGNKKGDKHKSVIPGYNLPNFAAQPSDGTANFDPFRQKFAFGQNFDSGDSVGFGVALTPNGNPHNIPFHMMYPSIVANGGKLPNFEENPLIGPFDPTTTMFAFGVAEEKIETNFGGNLKFPALKSKKMFDLGGGFSKRGSTVFNGGIAVPLLDQGVQAFYTGKWNWRKRPDQQTTYTHSLDNVNPLQIPIDQYYPYIVANPHLLFPGPAVGGGVNHQQRNIPVILHRSRRRIRGLADIVGVRPFLTD